MVAAIAPDARLVEQVREPTGRHHIHRLTLGVDAGSREAVLKATPGTDRTHAFEPRLLGLLESRTDLPVPAVEGVVDEHGELPAPFFVMTALPGRSVPKPGLGDLDRGTLRRIATGSGRHLAALHRVDAVDRFGIVGADPARSLGGERPAGRADAVTVVDPARTWPAFLRRSAAGTLARVRDTRFADLVPDLRNAIGTALAELEGPVAPTLCRVEHSIDNLLFDPVDGAVTGLLDWEFAVAGTPAYDLVLAEWFLAGGSWSLLPDATDRREPIRGALHAGYREAGTGEAVARARRYHDLYTLLIHGRTMAQLEDQLAVLDRGDPAVTAAADALRTRVRERL